MAAGVLAAGLLMVAGCGGEETLNETGTMLVTLPDGTKITAEVMVHPMDMMRGMMYRDSIAPDRGMLFIHNGEGKYPYWMHNVKIPLDIVWMNKNHTVVEISRDTPPCTSARASDCPNYGGHQMAAYVLELGGGQAKKHSVDEGDTISF